MYLTTADYDHVAITPSPFTTVVVNGTMMAKATNVGAPAGLVALGTYKALAAFADSLAYQP